MDPSLGLPEHQPPPPPPPAKEAAPAADAIAAPTAAMAAATSTVAHYHSGPYLYDAQPQQPVQPQPQPYLPHPAAYSSYHHPNTDPNPSPYTHVYPYAAPGPETAVQSGAHHAGGLGFPAASADPYSEYARGIYVPCEGYAGFCGVSPLYSYPAGGAPAVPAVPLYYGDHAGSEPLGYVMERLIHPHDGHPIGYGAGLAGPCIELEQPIPSHVNALHWKNKAMNSTSRLMKKKVPKGQKWTTMQSAYCEVCKVKCDTQEVLLIHKQGKKHMKNLQKLQESSVKSKNAPVETSEKIQLKQTSSVEKNINPATLVEKERATGEPKRKKNAAATSGDLEEKKRRILEGGAAADEVKVCTLCNVVVNSQKVYDYHIAGQKHASMLKKQEEKVAV